MLGFKCHVDDISFSTEKNSPINRSNQLINVAKHCFCYSYLIVPSTFYYAYLLYKHVFFSFLILSCCFTPLFGVEPYNRGLFLFVCSFQVAPLSKIEHSQPKEPLRNPFY